jgi:hypothetical protein
MQLEDYSEMPEPYVILAAMDLGTEFDKGVSLPGLDFSSPKTPSSSGGIAPAIPPKPRAKPVKMAKPVDGYSRMKQSGSAQQDSRADSIFGG